MSLPLVSIGVGTLNRPKLLARTVTSLVAQTYPNLEIIVSDNGSTDPDVDRVMEEFVKNDARIRYFKQPENRGAVFNLNFIIERATGDFVMRLGDDDWLDTAYVQKCLEFLLQNPDYVAAYGYAKLFTADEKFIVDDTKLDLVQPDPFERTIYFYKHVGNNGNYCGLVRKEYKPFLYFKLAMGDDWIAIARLIYLGKFKMVEGVNCNLSATGISSNLGQMAKALGLPYFVRAFPLLSICLNAAFDILWRSKAYKNLNIFRRIRFAWQCFLLLWRKQGVRHELKGGVKQYIKFTLRMQS